MARRHTESDVPSSFDCEKPRKTEALFMQQVMALARATNKLLETQTVVLGRVIRLV